MEDNTNLNNTNPNYATQAPQREPEHHAYRMVVVTVIVILVGLAIYFISARTNLFTALTGNSKSGGLFTKTEKDNSTVPFDPSKAWIEVTSESETGTVNQPITIILKGFSDGKDVNGYDILFGYNSADFDIVSAESMLPSFQIFKFTKKDHVTFTGVKSLTEKNSTVLNNTELLKITVRPKKKASLNFTILPSSGKEKTKFVDSQVQAIVPQVKSVKVAIE